MATESVPKIRSKFHAVPVVVTIAMSTRRSAEGATPVAIVALCSVGGASSTLMPRARGTIDGNARDVVTSQPGHRKVIPATSKVDFQNLSI
jgi:hypothetical protein